MKNNFYLNIGIIIFTIPFLGIPVDWRNWVVSILGFAIVIYSVWPSISVKISKKPETESE